MVAFGFQLFGSRLTLPGKPTAIRLCCRCQRVACYTDGINELGDLTGECWAQDYSVHQGVRWTTKDTTFSQVLGFPGDWSWSFRVNNDRVAVVTYGGGDKCSADDYISCGGAIQLH